MDNTSIVEVDDPDESPPALVDDALADELIARAQAEGIELLGPGGLLRQMTKAVLERALGEEPMLASPNPRARRKRMVPAAHIRGPVLLDGES